jgi:molecular chaperone GrpE
MANDPRETSSGDPAPRASYSDATARDPAPWTPAAPVPDVVPLESVAAMPSGATAPEVDRQAALRALRSLEATEARLERNARREADETRARLIQELLPVLDNLDRTIRAAQNGRSDPAMLEGVRMVRQQLEGVLRGYGVERIEALGQRFDPAMHDAIGMIGVDDPHRNGVVVHQVEPGYRFAGRLLRPAKVSVGKLVSPFDLRPTSAWR